MKKIWVLAALTGSLACAQISPAQFNISYSAVSPTPAPGTILLTVLGLLTAFVLYRKMRQMPVGRPLAAILFVIGLGLVQTREASATPLLLESMTGAGPLQFSVNSGQVAQVTNNTGVSQQITSVTLNPNPSSLTIVTPSSLPQCSAGFTVANGASCYVQASAL